MENVIEELVYVEKALSKLGTKEAKKALLEAGVLIDTDEVYRRFGKFSVGLNVFFLKKEDEKKAHIIAKYENESCLIISGLPKDAVAEEFLNTRLPQVEYSCETIEDGVAKVKFHDSAAWAVRKTLNDAAYWPAPLKASYPTTAHMTDVTKILQGEKQKVDEAGFKGTRIRGASLYQGQRELGRYLSPISTYQKLNDPKNDFVEPAPSRQQGGGAWTGGTWRPQGNMNGRGSNQNGKQGGFGGHGGQQGGPVPVNFWNNAQSSNNYGWNAGNGGHYGQNGFATPAHQYSGGQFGPVGFAAPAQQFNGGQFEPVGYVVPSQQFNGNQFGPGGFGGPTQQQYYGGYNK